MKRVKGLIHGTLCLGISLSVSLNSALAASDGTLGGTSSGTSDIEITVPELIAVNGIDDLTLNPYVSGAVSLFSDVCVYTNDPGGQYDVTISGDGGPNEANAFRLGINGNAGGRANLTYTAFWNDVSATNVGETAVTHAVELTAQTGANTASQTCAGGSSARLRINITEAEILSKQAGFFEGVITILVEPDGAN